MTTQFAQTSSLQDAPWKGRMSSTWVIAEGFARHHIDEGVVTSTKGKAVNQSTLRRKEPHNQQVLQTCCLRRGRRCRPLAARTHAADLHVGLTWNH